MSGYGLLALALLLGGMGPVVTMAAFGRALNRLVALEMGGAVATLFFLVFVEVTHQSYELILPLVLVPLSLAGTLVFTRLVKGADT